MFQLNPHGHNNNVRNRLIPTYSYDSISNFDEVIFPAKNHSHT